MWIVYALLSAFFAALTSILGKIGVENINSNVATAIRTIVVSGYICFNILGKEAGYG
jgi:transporter family protein